MDVHLERLQFKALFVRHIVERDRAEIGQAGLGTNGGVFGNLDRNLIAFVLVRESFHVRQRSADPALRMTVIVAELRRPMLCSWPFAPHASPLTVR